MPQDPARLAGAVLDGKYRLTDLLGQGGMGAVYRAHHVGTDRPVAVKVLLSELVSNPEAVERFRREARAAGRLRHPNVVDVTDFGVASLSGREIAYLVMEYLEGSSLRAALDARGALPLDIVVDIVEQIAAALESAHAADIVHRDLKPDNVWLVHDARGGFAVRVLDFGIARLGQETTAALPQAEPAVSMIAPTDVTMARSADQTLDEQTTPRLTTAGSLVGTPLYMSPEQCRAADVDHRTDVYSLGILTWEALAGRRPFEGTMREVISSHLNAKAPPLDHVSPRVAAVVGRAMEKSPADRYQSARAFAGSLRVAAEGPGVILRRSVALYAERFHEFFGISLRSSRPPVLLTAALLTLSVVLLIATGNRKLVLLPLVVAAAVAPVSWCLITVMTNTAFAAAIERLRLRPLEQIDSAALMDDLKERLGLRRSSGYLTTTVRLLWRYARTEMKAPVGAGDLAFIIGFLERVPAADIPARCALLATASSRAYSRVRAAIFAGLLALPLLEAGLLTLMFQPVGEKAAALAAVVAAGLVPVNAMLINPVFSAALALVYFRSRQAIGEDVALAAVLPGRL